MESWILSPVVQYGFLGFSAILLGIVVWLIRELIEVINNNNRVIAANTDVVSKHFALTSDIQWTIKDLRDKMLSRPCILDSRGGRNDK